MTDGSLRTDATANAIGNGNGDALCLAGGIRQTMDNRIAGAGQNLGGLLNAFFQTGRLALDGSEEPILYVMVEKPCLAEHAGVLRLGDMVVLDRQFHVVANAAAEGASGIGDDFDFRRHNDNSRLPLSGAGIWRSLHMLRTVLYLISGCRGTDLCCPLLVLYTL